MSEGLGPWAWVIARILNRWLPLRWSIPLVLGVTLLLALLVPPLLRWWSG